MKIHTLKIAISEAELASAAIPALSGYVKNLRITCHEGHALVEGHVSYPMPLVGEIPVPISLTCEITVSPDGRELVAAIVQASAGPVPATAFVGYLLGLVPRSPGIRVEDSSVHVSPIELLAKKGIQLDATLHSVAVHPGEVVIECGCAGNGDARAGVEEGDVAVDGEALPPG